MSKDESVDGPKIAADIINRMSGEKKERIVRAISQKAPSLAQKIEDNLINFEKIGELTPQGVQTLMHNVNSLDLVLSLRGADPHTKEFMLTNLSSRKQARVREELSARFSGEVNEIKSAQRRILAVLEDLKRSGKLQSRDPKHLWV